MDYDDLHLTDLRRYAKKIGIKNPTTFTKSALINLIEDIENGRRFAEFTKKGRPMRKKEVGVVLDCVCQNVKEKANHGVDVSKNMLIYAIRRIRGFLLELEDELTNFKDEKSED